MRIRMGAVVAAVFACLAALPAIAFGCVNESWRTGASIGLPDCRAYELVTPADLATVPKTAGGGLLFALLSLDGFQSPSAAEDGNGFVFGVVGTGSPDLGGGGFVNTYRARRAADGWLTTLVGPGGEQAAAASPGGFSADQSFQAFGVAHLKGRFSGSLDLGAEEGTEYVRSPDGSFHLAGEGTLAANPDLDGNPNGLADELHPRVRWISAGGSHIVFTQNSSPVRLVPDAPPSGVGAVYDRTPSELRIASLLPTGVPLTGDSLFEGASADGSTILFKSEGVLYARLNGSSTETIATGEVQAAGVDATGTVVFYVEGTGGTGDLFSYNLNSQQRTAIVSSGDARFVNLSADGSHVFFESPTRLDGVHGVDGQPNLYVWDGTSNTFIATVQSSDLLRETSPAGGRIGLAQLVQPDLDSPSRNGSGLFDTSRTTPDGSALAFESSANLTGAGGGGEVDVYLYNVLDRQLACVSCASDPLAGSATGDAGFADYSRADVGSTTEIPNLSRDGRTVFFETAQPLAEGDVNGATDVYEWRDGRISLLTTGRSSQPSLLMGATPDGHDVFVRTAERLVPGGQEDGAEAIYDAREDGGFPAPDRQSPCPLQSCQGDPWLEGIEPRPGSAVLAGKVRSHRRCRSKHRRHSHRRVRCAGRHRHPRAARSIHGKIRGGADVG